MDCDRNLLDPLDERGIFKAIEVPLFSRSSAHSKVAKKRAIEARPSLWDATCAEYKNRKETTWEEVADAIPASLNDCKGKWANLRITFNRNLNTLRKKKVGQSIEDLDTISWKYFKPMMFLETATAPETKQLRLESVTTDETVDNDLDFSQIDERRIYKTSPPSSTTSTFCITGRNKELEKTAIEERRSVPSIDLQFKDPSTAFCEYIASELRTLSSKQAAFVRAKLRHAFNNIMDEVASTLT